MNTTKGQLFKKELEMEAAATRKCLERVPENLYDYQPHERSMKLGYLLLVIAEIPHWISHVIEVGDVDFGSFEHDKPKTTAEMVAVFDKNFAHAKEVLSTVSDEELAKSFSLKNKGQVLMTSSKEETVSSSINHLAHHRGQLTVYMRLNNIPVPSIYGPSADDKSF